ncbi:MAG TPA: phage protein Gp36 family protein [Rariglobus sp.]|jgi:phage gp36-like protein|nr:phage protein Gp36 family protein [Rariglobus sp.]
MPAYITRSQLNALVPPQFVLQALDDNSDGVEDAGLFDQILANAQLEIDGALGKRYTTPFQNPIPAIIANATLIFVGEALYTRRGYGDEAKPNPFATRAKDIRADLAEVAAGKVPLYPTLNRAKPSGTVIADKAKTSSPAGRTSV